MPRGVPKAGFRNTKNRLASNVEPMIHNLVPVVHETDEEIREKLKSRFAAMNQMTEAAFSGIVKSLIVAGPAGLGKSFGVMAIADQMKAAGKTVEVVKGFVRATGLYKVLYENRFPHSVVIFDDADSVFADEDSLNLLKGACDMTRERTLSWRAETNMKSEDGEYLPNKYEFEGTIIFITNMDFDYVINKQGRLAPHFQAMISRSMYLDLGMKSDRDYLVRIRMVVEEGMLKDLGLNAIQEYEIVNFIEQNYSKLRELSLRMVRKVAALYAMDENNWKNLAKCTCFKPH